MVSKACIPSYDWVLMSSRVRFVTNKMVAYMINVTIRGLVPIFFSSFQHMTCHIMEYYFVQPRENLSEQVCVLHLR